MTPRENLRQEHGNIMKELSRFQKLIKDGKHPRKGQRKELIRDLDTIFDFMDVYVDQCHHGKEETIIFPVLAASRAANADTLVSELCRDHKDAVALLAALKTEFLRSKNDARFPDDTFVAQSEQYITRLRTHIRKENAQLLPEIERTIPEAEQSRIERELELFEQNINRLKEIRLSLDIYG